MKEDNTAKTGGLRVLLACARPLADRLVSVEAECSSLDEKKADKLKLHFKSELGMEALASHQEENLFRLLFPAPAPEDDRIVASAKELDFVTEASVLKNPPQANDIHLPGGMLATVQAGLENIQSRIELSVITRTEPEDLKKALAREPGYDVVHFVGHCSSFGAMLFENGDGWTKHVNPGELAEIIGGKATVFINSACFGEKSMEELQKKPEGERPRALIYTPGEYPNHPSSLHLFSNGFYKALAAGKDVKNAFSAGVDMVRQDDYVGETAFPSSSEEGKPLSPFQMFELDQCGDASFSGVEKGSVKILEGARPKPFHVMMRRLSEHVLGREVPTAGLIGMLSGAKGENRPRLVSIFGHDGIGKTTLAQTACEHLWDYGRFSGGIYEVDCEDALDDSGLASAILASMGKQESDFFSNPKNAALNALKEASSENEVFLLLDSLENAAENAVAQAPAFLQSLLEQCPNLYIAATTQEPLEAEGWDKFEVEPLNMDSALGLFINSISSAEVRGNLPGVNQESKTRTLQLLNELHGNTLAIILAACRFSRSKGDLNKAVEKTLEDVINMMNSSEIENLPNKKKALTASLNLSYNLLSRPAWEMLEKMSFFPGGLRRFWKEQENLLGEKWLEALDELSGLGLCNYDDDIQWHWTLPVIRRFGESKLLAGENNSFYAQAARHWAEFASRQAFLMEPESNQAEMDKLDLPDEPEELKAELAQLRSFGLSAMRLEEKNIIRAFDWSIENDPETAEAILAPFKQYLTAAGKKGTLALMEKKLADKKE